MSICKRLNISPYVYNEWLNNIEALLNNDFNLNSIKLEIDNLLNDYSIEKFFIEYSILKDLEPKYKDNPIFIMWMSALKESIALRKIKGLSFI